MVIAGEAAKSVEGLIVKGDPFAQRLTAMPYARDLLTVFAEYCSPVNGYLRHYGEDGDATSKDVLPLLAMLAPEVSLSGRSTSRPVSARQMCAGCCFAVRVLYHGAFRGGVTTTVACVLRGERLS